MIRIVRLAAVAAAISGLGWLVVSMAEMIGSFAGLVDLETIHAFVFQTSFGPILIVRLIASCCLVPLALAPMGPAPRFGFMAATSAFLMISQAWLGHAAEGGDTLVGAAMIAAYAVHVLSAAAWAGALPALALALAERWRQGQGGHDLLSRYSIMATVAVGLVILSGLANTIYHVGTIATLATTIYGGVLLTKLTLVVAMLVLAAVNRFVITPRLRAGPHEGSVSRMRMSLSVERVLAALVLGAVAVLGITPPPQ